MDATRGAGSGKGAARRAVAFGAASAALGALAHEPGAPAPVGAIVGLLAFAPVLYACKRLAPRAAFAAGWIASTGIALAGYRFVPSAVAASGALPSALAWPAFVLFAVYLGIPVAVAAWLGARVESAGRSGTLVAAAAIAVFETLLPNPLPFAFGGTLISTLQLVQVADVLGPLGLTLVATLAAACVAELVDRERRDRVVIGVGASAVLLAWMYGVLRMRALEEDLVEAPLLRAQLVQLARAPGEGEGEGEETRTNREAGRRGGYGEGERFDGREMSSDVDLVVYPESTLPTSVAAVDLEPLVERLFSAPRAAPTILGATEDDGRSLANVALLLDEHGQIAGRYEKRELLALAEPETRAPWPVAPWQNGRLYRAGTKQPTLTVEGIRLAVTICYEATLSSRMREAVRETDGEVLVNLANDAWFSSTHEPELHFIAARLRSIETRRSMLRSANAGVTAAIDPLGRVVTRAPGNGQTAVSVSVPVSSTRSAYLRWGAAPSLIVAGLIAALGLSRSAPSKGRKSERPARAKARKS